MKKKSVLEKREAGGKRGKYFAQKLLQWNRYDNTRQMPWKGEKDPYKIWLSEVILQQTRVEQGLKYYQNFIVAFPNIKDLAAAPEEKVFKLWEGLGYYSRCRNLIQTAKFISAEMNGDFPKAYSTILSLKGVGSYTAAAIASFAYNLPYAVLDGNVFRVLSRIFDMEIPIDSTQGKKEFLTVAQQLLPQKKAGEYNQAIMDFGAVVCKPVPLCDSCFFNKQCLAYLAGKQDLLPVKEKQIKIRKRWLNYFIVQCGDEVLIQQRAGKDIWQGLFQFVLIETAKGEKANTLLRLLEKQFGLPPLCAIREWSEEQKLSHQTICFYFLQIEIKKKVPLQNHTWMKLASLQDLAFPKTLQQALIKVSSRQ
ncbi:MAG TPA: A/G-specific adenine glycosylase [Flavisolibacter sp.]|jgi:A/G-specific adenine glycosylase|nr:A/G-specific adenine glycosylase [Flavisolibacter sp.]